MSCAKQCARFSPGRFYGLSTVKSDKLLVMENGVRRRFHHRDFTLYEGLLFFPDLAR